MRGTSDGSPRRAGSGGGSRLGVACVALGLAALVAGCDGSRGGGGPADANVGPRSPNDASTPRSDASQGGAGGAIQGGGSGGGAGTGGGAGSSSSGGSSGGSGSGSGGSGGGGGG